MFGKSMLISLAGLLGFLAAMGASAYTVPFNGGTFGLSAVAGSDCGVTSGHCYDVTYTASFAGWTSTTQTSFSALAFNVVPGSTDILGFGGPTGATTINDKGLSAGGCAVASLGANWLCTTLASSDPTSGSYSFNYWVLTDSAANFNGSSIKMLFNQGLMSCSATECGATSVPEPATLGLLGLGLAAIGLMRRRKPA